MATAQVAWFQAGVWSAIDQLRAAASTIKANGVWEARAMAAIGDDLTHLQATLANIALSEDSDSESLLANRSTAVNAAIDLAREAALIPEIVSLSVALRVLYKALLVIR